MAPARTSRRGLSTTGLLSLVAVVAVLLVISLPRLRSFARHQNERDAAFTADLIATVLEGDVEATELPCLQVLTRDLLRRLPDSEFLDDGCTLRRHGYLFTVCRLESPPPASGVVLAAPPAPGPQLAVHARPWRFGRTGRRTIVALADGRIFEHPNREGHLSVNPHRASGAWSWQGWREGR